MDKGGWRGSLKGPRNDSDGDRNTEVDFDVEGNTAVVGNAEVAGESARGRKKERRNIWSTVRSRVRG